VGSCGDSRARVRTDKVGVTGYDVYLIGVSAVERAGRHAAERPRVSAHVTGTRAQSSCCWPGSFPCQRSHEWRELTSESRTVARRAYNIEPRLILELSDCSGRVSYELGVGSALALEDSLYKLEMIRTAVQHVEDALKRRSCTRSGGFVKKTEIPLGEARWLTVVSLRSRREPSCCSTRRASRREAVQASAGRGRHPLHLVCRRRRPERVRATSQPRCPVHPRAGRGGPSDDSRLRRHVRQPDPNREPEVADLSTTRRAGVVCRGDSRRPSRGARDGARHSPRDGKPASGRVCRSPYPLARAR